MNGRSLRCRPLLLRIQGLVALNAMHQAGVGVAILATVAGMLLRLGKSRCRGSLKRHTGLRRHGKLAEQEQR